MYVCIDTVIGMKNVRLKEDLNQATYFVHPINQLCYSFFCTKNLIIYYILSHKDNLFIFLNVLHVQLKEKQSTLPCALNHLRQSPGSLQSSRSRQIFTFHNFIHLYGDQMFGALKGVHSMKHSHHPIIHIERSFCVSILKSLFLQKQT